MKIEPLAFNIPDPRAAADWYAAHLGMRVVRSGPPPKHGRFIADDRGMMIELYNDPADQYLDLARLGEATFHLAVVSEDIDADSVRLCAAGAQQIGDINRTTKGDRVLFLRDPFGLTLQLVQRAETIV